MTFVVTSCAFNDKVEVILACSPGFHAITLERSINFYENHLFKLKSSQCSTEPVNIALNWRLLKTQEKNE